MGGCGAGWGCDGAACCRGGSPGLAGSIALGSCDGAEGLDAGGSPGLLDWFGSGVTAPCNAGGSAPCRGTSFGTFGVSAVLAGAPGVAVGGVAATFGPGAARLSIAAGLAKVGMSATAVFVVAMLAAARACACARGSAGEGDRVGGTAVPGAGVADWAAAGRASETVGAGGAATGTTGTVATRSGATRSAVRDTGCERTKAAAGTTVAKRWFISRRFWAVIPPSRHSVRRHLSSSMRSCTAAERLICW